MIPKLFLVVVSLALADAAQAQGTAFTYQGRLENAGSLVTGSYDFIFSLHDAVSGGTPKGVTWTNSTTPVNQGLFTVTLDCGNQFPGASRWLEIGVRTNGDTQPYTILAPRQSLTATPYAIYSGSASNAASVNAANISGALALSQLPAGVLTNGASLTGAFTGNGAGLTNLNATNITGSLALSQIPKVVLTNGASLTGNFIGNGAGLTNLNAMNISGSLALAQLPGAVLTNGSTLAGNGAVMTNLNAANISAGSLADERLSANVALRSGGNNFTGPQSFIGGNVGIGTLTPKGTLHVNGSYYGLGEFSLHAWPSDQTSGTAFIQAHDTTNSSIGLQFRTQTNGAYVDALYISPGGNVGIRTGNPFAPLDLSTALGEKISLWGVSPTNIIGLGIQGSLMQIHTDQSGTDIAFGHGPSANMTELMRIKGNGNVGIGTNNPLTKLHVNGSVTATAFAGAVNATNVAGILSPAQLPASVVTNGGPITGTSASFTGSAVASSFSGSGAGLSNLNASALSTGILPVARLSTNVALRTGGNGFLGSQTITSGRLGVGTTNPQRLLQVGDINVLGSEGMIHLASKSAAGDASRAWDIGVPQTGGNASGIGYSFIIDDPVVGNNQPEFLIRWDTGYVGLGTNNPEARLHVQNDFKSAVITPSTPGNSTYLEFGNQLGFRGLIGADGQGFSGSSNTFSLGTFSAAPVKFFTAAAQRMIIAADGNVGIGTTDPGLNNVQINPTHHAANGYGLVVNHESQGMNIQINPANGLNGIGLAVDDHSPGSASTSLLLLRRRFGNNVPVTVMNVRSDGRTQVKELEITGGADLSEPFNVSDTEAKPGMVMAIDPDKPGELRICTEAYDRTVAGIISGAGGVKPGLTLRQQDTVADGSHPVALSGRAYCWVDADANGPVRPGDLLTSSDTAGHAMRATDQSRSHGAVLGKAMTRLKSGRGLVLVLVNLQ